MNLPPVLSAADVELAWRRCAAENPTVPPAYAMCEDASKIADVYARILAYGLPNVEVCTLKPDTCAALARWLPSPPENR